MKKDSPQFWSTVGSLSIYRGRQIYTFVSKKRRLIECRKEIPRVNAEELAKLFNEFMRTPSKIGNEPNIEKIEVAKKYTRVRKLYLVGA